MAYLVKTAFDKFSKIRVVPLSNQGLNTAFNVSCDKDVRALHPVGTVFAVTDLFDRGKFYAAEDYKLYPVHDGSKFLTTNEEFRELYQKVVDGLEGELDEVIPEKEDKPKVKKIPSLRDRLLKDSSLEPPTIEEDGFYVDKDVWYLLLRNIKKNKNTMLLGPTGAGKTELVMLLATKLAKELFIHDMGTLHDPMSGLLGTHRISSDGKSVFDYSRFSQEIKREGIMLLDELSRAPLSTNNILVPCLDSRRELYIDIAMGEGERIIKVNEELCFFATANIGSEYTGTTMIDRAVQDRFFPVQLDYMSADLEAKLLAVRTKLNVPECRLIAEIASKIRKSYVSGDLSTSLSHRHTLEVASLVKDGFSVLFAFEQIVLPMFEGSSSDGERAVVKTFILSK